MASQIHASEHRVVEGSGEEQGSSPKVSAHTGGRGTFGEGSGRNVEDVVFCIGFSSRSQNLGAAMGGGCTLRT